MGLQIFWFIVIAVLWCGFFVLEGFDFGVGMLHWFVGKNDVDRRVAINTIGPFWDGNEVWLIVAGAGIFAAFPAWYATMFSALYLPLVLILIGLIIRGVAFEYRGKRDSDRWRTTWSMALVVGSALVPLLLAVGLGDLLSGLPVNAQQEFTGNFWNLLTAYGLATGVTMLALCLLHGATFLMLKTTGDVHAAARGFARRVAWPAAAIVLGFVIWTHVISGHGVLLTPLRGRRRPRGNRRRLARRGRPRGLGIRGDRSHDPVLHRLDLRGPLPQRAGLQHERRLQPHGWQQRVRRLRAEGDDRRRGGPVPGRAALPGLDLLRLPQARGGRAGPASKTGCGARRLRVHGQTCDPLRGMLTGPGRDVIVTTAQEE